MPIKFEKEIKSFKLDTKSTSYIIRVSQDSFLLHQYYGGYISDCDLSYLYRECDRPFSPNPGWHKGRTFSLDTQPQEYSCNGTGDLRSSALSIRTIFGNTATSILYKSHKVYFGTIISSHFASCKSHR